MQFLNVEGPLAGPSDWNNPAYPLLWRYQLHYFDDLCASGTEARSDWQRDLIARWIRDNPPGAAVAWDPYPLSLRVANWIKWHLGGRTLDAEARASLIQQVRYLRSRLEYHLLANHLLENLKALVIAGCFFDGAEPDTWRTEALAQLRQQLREQILPDGGHFERAPMYHGLTAEALLDIVNVLRAYGFETPEWLLACCERMMAWSVAMAHSDGDWAQFNDTALGYAARPGALISYWQRLGGVAPDAPGSLVVLPESGFVRAQQRDLLLFVDVGNLGPDYNPAHGHADTLCFELSRGSNRLVVDAGVSTYERGAVRQWERSTRAHNTVEIDSENSSEVWDAFRVARRAKARLLKATAEADGIVIAGEHDGYRRLRGQPIHRRTMWFSKNALEVTDHIESRAHHDLHSRMHLHPTLSVRESASGALEITDTTGESIACLEDCTWPIARIDRYEYAPAFGRREPAQVIVLRGSCRGTGTLRYSLRLKG